MVFIEDKLCAITKPIRFGKSLNFVANFFARMFVDSEWPWNILWSDKAHFMLDRAVNNENCCIWGSVHPYVVHERSSLSDYICVTFFLHAEHFSRSPKVFHHEFTLSPSTVRHFCFRSTTVLRDYMQDNAPPQIA